MLLKYFKSMDKYITLLFVCLLSSVSIAQKKDNYNERIKSVGIKYKTVYVWQYENDMPNDSIIYSYNEFNKRGRTLKSITYKDRQKNSELTLEYNTNGKVKTGHNILFNDAGDTNHINITYYDSKERVIETNNTYGLGNYWIKTLYTYDKNNNIQTSKNIGELDTTVYTTKYIFDENGNTIRSIHKDKNGNIYSEWINTYDENDNLIEQQYIDYGNKLFSFSNKSKFNADNFEIERSDYDSFGNLKSRFVYTNDENGNVKEYVEYDDTNRIISRYKVYYKYF